MERDSENRLVMYILLPECIEAEDDVFLTILKAIVGRTNLDRNPLINALINGMKVDTFKIECEDVGSWNNLNSQSQRIRQAMMLGFWAIKNYPLLAIRLCGDGWKAPQRKFVQIVGGEPILPDDFDLFIFGKMKVRLIELHERKDKDTLQRLKSFVKAPTGIGKTNRIPLSNRSKNMFSFDVESGFNNQCWHALRSGCTDDESSNSSESQMINMTNVVPIPQIDQDSVSNHSSHLAKRRRRGSSSNNDATTDAIDNLSTESLQTILLEIHRDVGDLTKWLKPASDCQENDDAQRAHLKVITEKNEVIDKLKHTEDCLRKEVERLKEDIASLNGQIETDAGLMSLLKSGAAAHQKLYTQLESQLLALQKSIDNQQQIIIAKDKELDDATMMVDSLKTQLNCLINDDEPELKSQIDELRKTSAESSAKNESLEVLCKEWMEYANTKTKELTQANEIISDLRNQIETTKQLLAESTVKNGFLDGQLAEKKISGDASDKELEITKTMVECLQEQLNQSKTDVQALETKLTEATAMNGNLNGQLAEWKVYAAAKDKELDEAKISANALQDQLNSLKNDVDNMLPTVQNEIGNLERKVTESTAKNEALGNQLVEWKASAAAKDKELKEAKMTADHLQKQLNCRINELQLMLNELKVCGHAKDEELEKAKGEIIRLQDQLKHSNNDRFAKVDGNKNYEDDDFTTKTEAENQNENTFNSECTQNDGEISDTNECPRNKEVPLTTTDLSLPMEVSDNPMELSNNPKLDRINVTQNQHGNGYQEFESDDPIVRACRPILLAQRFGWIKFNANKNCRAWPGFVYPPDEDGFARAQRITPDGYVSDVKNLFSQIDENIPETEKGKAQLKALNKFNEKFSLQFA